MRGRGKSQAFALPSRAGSLELVGGELALDLTNTSSGRGTGAHQEHLRDFDSAMRWVAHARILTPDECAYIRKAVALHPKRARAIFARASSGRWPIWRSIALALLGFYFTAIATALAEQRPVAARLRAALTAAHAASLRLAEIRLRDGAYMWTWSARRDIQTAILGPITLSAMTLLMEKDLSRTKRCAGLECGWMFYDNTKNKRRRWCEMRVCGNRAKVRAARARRKLRATHR